MSNSKKIAIVDYELGNLFSVKQACLSLGYNAVLTSEPLEIEKSDMLILPGVGAFGEAMSNLKRLGLDKLIVDSVQRGKPMMGVCLGLQLLFDESEEFGNTEGLGLLKGKVKKFPQMSPNGEKLLIPQIAWNRVGFNNLLLKEKSPMAATPDKSYFYFVHSYYVAPDSEEIKLTSTNYGGFEYCSSVLKNNIFAVQFHPEKSGDLGLQLYKNWLSQ